MNVDISVNIVVSGEVIHKVVIDPRQSLITQLAGNAAAINEAADQAGRTADQLDREAPAPSNTQS
jgi:hypothetical protein